MERIKTKSSYKFIIIVGGLILLLIGIYQLSHPFVMDKGGIPNWFLGIPFSFFGIGAIISYLDFLYVVIREEEIEIKSIFRKRVILLKEITGYGIEDYKGKHVSGERIRIFTNNSNTKFHTTQLENIDEIKRLMRKKKRIINGAFRRDRINDIVAFLLMFITLLSPIYFDQDKETLEGKGAIDAIGIPATLGKELTIIAEEDDLIIFKLEKYKHYLFKVKTEDTPKNMKITNKELVVIIDNKEYAQELKHKQDPRTNSRERKTIPVDEIMILE